jgi:hypothetical protein
LAVDAAWLAFTLAPGFPVRGRRLERHLGASEPGAAEDEAVSGPRSEPATPPAV